MILIPASLARPPVAYCVSAYVMSNEMDLYDQLGKVALGSRLRRLGERLAEDSARVFDFYDVPLKPRWYPVFIAVARLAPASVKELAAAIGQSHASVSQVLKELDRAGLVTTGKCEQDARLTRTRLSDNGKAVLPRLEVQNRDAREAVDEMLEEVGLDLWEAIQGLERSLSRQSFLERVRSTSRRRLSSEVRIVDFTPRYREDFARLNYAWIERWFRIEAADRNSLDDPERTILAPGGHIFMALLGDDAIGTCALIRRDAAVYELAKMAVDDRAQGRGVGERLGRAVIDRARDLGARQVVLDSNTILEPAIRLYRRLGFKELPRMPTDYERSNIQMALEL